MLRSMASPDLSATLDAVRAGTRPADLEGERLEFKEEADTPKRTLEMVADAVVCLANSTGGEVVVGVSDKHRAPTRSLECPAGSHRTCWRVGCSSEPDPHCRFRSRQ